MDVPLMVLPWTLLDIFAVKLQNVHLIGSKLTRTKFVKILMAFETFTIWMNLIFFGMTAHLCLNHCRPFYYIEIMLLVNFRPPAYTLGIIFTAKMLKVRHLEEKKVNRWSCRQRKAARRCMMQMTFVKFVCGPPMWLRLARSEWEQSLFPMESAKQNGNRICNTHLFDGYG